jgi:hypothetical protein
MARCIVLSVALPGFGLPNRSEISSSSRDSSTLTAKSMSDFGRRRLGGRRSGRRGCVRRRGLAGSMHASRFCVGGSCQVSAPRDVRFVPSGSTLGVRGRGLIVAVTGMVAAGGVKNTWTKPGYQGINSFWREPRTGQVFEVQFHTPESFQAKMDTHGIYERTRVPGLDDATVEALESEQKRVFASVPSPGGAAGLTKDVLFP